MTDDSILAARADLADALADALAGVWLDSSELRMTKWLAEWDQPTLHTLASIIRKARATGVSETAVSGREDES